MLTRTGASCFFGTASPVTAIEIANSASAETTLRNASDQIGGM